MDTILIGLGFIILIVVIWGLIGSRTSNISITDSDYIRKQYKYIFNRLYDSSYEIFSQNFRYIEFGKKDYQNDTRFVLTEDYGKLIIKWKHTSWRFGSHSLEWKFDDRKNQADIYRILKDEIEKYENNLLKNIN